MEVPAPPTMDSKRHTLLDEVDLISGVSGGSFTASYFGLHGRDIFNDFRTEFLYGDFQGAMLWGLANPVNWVRLWSPRFGRSDMAQEYYDYKLFKGATLGDIAKKPGPVVIVLATEAIEGISFGFTPSQFALICSDFDKFPVSRAVAASAASRAPFRRWSERLRGPVRHTDTAMDRKVPGQPGHLQPDLLQCAEDEDLPQPQDQTLHLPDRRGGFGQPRGPGHRRVPHRPGRHP